MYHPKRSRLRIIGSLIVVVSASIFPVTAASADVLPNNPIINDYSSDPDARWCYTGNAWGLCLTTSRDDRPSGWNYNGGNPYPMSVTRMYFLPQGSNPGVQSNWQAKGSSVSVDGTSVGGVVFRENPGYSGWVDNNTRHLWAPTDWYNNPWGRYNLLVPDLDVTNQPHASSRIGVSRSASIDPGSTYTYLHTMNLATNGNGSAAPNGGYASDPSFSNDWWPFITYANGDFDTRPCGKISFAQLDFELSVLSGWPKPLVINQASPPAGTVNMTSVPTSLRGCDNNNDYYFEGPELFYRNVNGTQKWYLMFASKPQSGNSVIAYAMADNIDGPYTYRGIIMSGSSTEWTNQATIVEGWGPNGMSLFFYHDGASGTPHSRKVHAECFRFNADGTIPTITRTTSTSSSNWVGNCWDD
ncbi:hypothetical protein Acor_49650 [Acrocarpospora corrugata]|uniref:Glycosyl hydrolase family 43 n=1 Tax=Acrocarpospora corrugata TaxID=35763 RepID=A0A5M3W3P2_9ACTN|nr:hypothetical protein [Acrocarpospora corrugata]GES02899.1 hypothetical protein Acor_49650 [Acrocarpospora corrugata]